MRKPTGVQKVLRRQRHSDDEIVQLWLGLKTLNPEMLGVETDFLGISDTIPTNETALAEALGISRQTIHNWKGNPTFQLGVKAAYRELLAANFEKKAMDLFVTLTELAEGGDPRSQKLWWDLFKELRPAIFVDHDPDTIRLIRDNKTGGDEVDKLKQLLSDAPFKEDASKPEIQDADFEMVEGGANEVEGSVPDDGAVAGNGVDGAEGGVDRLKDALGLGSKDKDD